MAALFEGLISSRDEQNMIQGERDPHIFGNCQMAMVDGIECAPQNTNPLCHWHNNPALTPTAGIDAWQ
jgi:hypothetical protein